VAAAFPKVEVCFQYLLVRVGGHVAETITPIRYYANIFITIMYSIYMIYDRLLIFHILSRTNEKSEQKSYFMSTLLDIFTPQITINTCLVND